MTTSTPLRAGDSERDATAAILGQALVEGYLDVAEYEGDLVGPILGVGADDVGERRDRHCAKVASAVVSAAGPTEPTGGRNSRASKGTNVA